MGRIHIQHYLTHPQAKVQAICDADTALAEKTAKEYGIPQVFSSYETFLKEAEVDAVSLVVPNFLHHGMVLGALDRGLHVLCEKPMALNTAEALEMQARVKASGRKFMIHFNQRFRAEHQYMRSLVASGDLGPIYYGTASWRRMRYIPRFGGWFTDKTRSGGGPLIDLGVHMIDLTRWIMGRPRVVSVSASTYNHIGGRLASEQGKTFNVEDLASAFIRFDTGATLQLEASWALNFEERERIALELSGTLGGFSSVTYDYKDKHLAVFREIDGVLTRTEPIRFPAEYENAQQHFVNAILNDTEPDATAEDGVEIMRILDAAYESAALGREVAVCRD